MTTANAPHAGPWARLSTRLGALVPHDLLALVDRIAIAAIFWLSGRTKVDGWLHLTDGAVELFTLRGHRHAVLLLVAGCTHVDGGERETRRLHARRARIHFTVRVQR